MADPLPQAELDAFLKSHPGWSMKGPMLTRTFEAKTFLAGIDFVSRVAKVAEAADHHPDIDIRWRKVTLAFVTHDAGNTVTALDTKLAHEATQLFDTM